MEAKELLTKIRQVFAEFNASAPAPAAPVTMSDYELKIGGMVSIDKLEVGGVVMIDGNPAIPGELELADGTILVIGDNGVITEVKPPVTAPAEEPAAPATPGMDMSKFKAFESLTNEKFASYEAKFAAYETRFAAYEEKLNQSKQMIEQLLQFGKIMVEKPIVAPDASVKTSNAFKADKPERNFDILFS
jgi:hypothetical protein